MTSVASTKPKTAIVNGGGANRFSICTFNLWCPHWNGQESKNLEKWTKRHSNILNVLLSQKTNTTEIDNNTNDGSNNSEVNNDESTAPSAAAAATAELGLNCDIFCLQEFWCPQSNHPFVELYTNHFTAHNYSLFYFKRRSQRKPDGIAIAFNNKTFELIENASFTENPLRYGYTVSNRVALLAHLRHIASGNEFTISTSHLTFPSDPEDIPLRSKQGREWISIVDTFADENKSKCVASLMCGDYNCELNQNECQMNISNGYVSSYHECNSGENKKKKKKKNQNNSHANEDIPFVSHWSHENRATGCDFIFYKNHSKTDASDNNAMMATAIAPVLSYMYPTDIATDIWPDTADYSLSDHRPIVTLFDIVAKQSDQ